LDILYPLSKGQDRLQAIGACCVIAGVYTKLIRPQVGSLWCVQCTHTALVVLNAVVGFLRLSTKV
jgi:hypothetical protein